MTRTHLLPVTALILLLSFIPTATATLVLADVAFTPNAPLVPGSQQQIVAQYALIPSGSTTFTKGHELQMQTGLSNAKWSIQVTLDGRNAAYQTASGNAAFVTGGILSYSTNHDVGMIVTIDGLVPQDATNPLMVLQIVEIDNSGNIVPGSTLTISQPVAGVAPVQTTVPTLTPVVVIPQTTAPRAPGFEGAVGIAACCLAALATIRRG
jgi:hypothetical protein